MNETQKTEQIEAAKRLLAEHGFRVEIGGCGCCGSPWVRIEHNGIEVVGDSGKSVDGADINMFPA
jgi:hypothetical protein